MARSRFIAVWAGAEERARIYGVAALVLAGLLAGNGIATWLLLTRPREVVRIGCDGIPTLVQLNESIYQEAAPYELQWFAERFTTQLLRLDSYSLRQDWLYCSSRMVQELQRGFMREARGTTETPGLVPLIEQLGQRTDLRSVKVEVDKEPYPWVARVTAMRRIVPTKDGEEAIEEPVEIELELVRADRSRVIEGVLVAAMRINAQPWTLGIRSRPNE